MLRRTGGSRSIGTRRDLGSLPGPFVQPFALGPSKFGAEWQIAVVQEVSTGC